MKTKKVKKTTKPGPGRKRKGKTYPPEPLTRDEVKALIKVCSNRAPTGIRNKAIIVTLYRCGLRISEALSLKAKDIDREAETVRILRGKGAKHRTVPIDAEALAYLDRWIEIKASKKINGHSYLFCTLAGKPLTRAYMNVLFPRLARKAGIQKRVSPHGLRHTWALERIREGVALNALSGGLGHAGTSVTDKYLDNIASFDVVEALRNRPKWDE